MIAPDVRVQVDEVKAAYEAAKTPIERIVVLNDARWPFAARVVAATEIST